MYEVHRRLCPLISSKGVLIAHSQAPRSNDNQVENPPSRLSRLAAPLTGYHLLNVVSVLVFGTWKVVMSDHKGLVVVTRVELILVMISGLVCAFRSFKCGRLQVCRSDVPLRLYYAKMLEKRPDVCPGFYKVNLAPLIWRFVYRSEGECCVILSIVMLPWGRLLTAWSVQCISFFCRYYLCGRLWHCYDLRWTSDSVSSLGIDYPARMLSQEMRSSRRLWC